MRENIRDHDFKDLKDSGILEIPQVYYFNYPVPQRD